MGRKRLKGELINFRAYRHSYYNLKYNLILVTKDKKECINQMIKERLYQIFKNMIEDRNGVLLEFKASSNLIHLYLELPANLNLADFITNFKTVSSRLIRKEFNEYLKEFYENGFWNENYGVFTENLNVQEYIDEFLTFI